MIWFNYQVPYPSITFLSWSTVTDLDVWNLVRWREKKEFCFSELVCIERIGIHHAPTILSAHFIYNILTTLSHWFAACFNPLTTCQSKILGDHFTGCLKPEWNNELDWTKDISMFGRFISPFMWPLFIYPIHKFESLYILDNES